MNCELMEESLMRFHLGEMDPSSREGLEGHLVECNQCLRGYFQLKGCWEDSLKAGPVPSVKVRRRIRESVVGVRPSVWRGKQVYGVWATAAILAIVLVVPSLFHSPEKLQLPTEKLRLERVDTSRQEPVAINFL